MPASDGVARWSADAAPELGRQLRPARRGQLVGMEPGQQPVAGGRLQDPPRLVRVEHPALAEDVAEPRPAVRRHPGRAAPR